MHKKEKIMKKMHYFTALVTVVFLLFSCNPSEKEEEIPEEKETEVDFTSHNTGYSVLVRNYTSERLVAFKGDLLPEKLIGGIPAHATGGHGLPKDPALFDKTEDFPMILLTEAQYNANKGNLSSQKNSPFTRVYVFFNNSGDNTLVYDIAEGLGGNNSLKIINASNSINVELRVNGVAGETLGYAPAGILETTLKLQDGNYNIFPVFKRYNKFRDVVETTYPQGAGTNYAYFMAYSFGEGFTEATMNLKSILSTIKLTSGTAWVVINNNTTSGGIRFVEGTFVYSTASGLTNIMSGSPRTFQIEMPKVGTKYADSVIKSGWQFGPAGFEVDLQTSETDATKVQSLTIERDKMYTITVTGDHNAGTLKAWLSDTTEINSDELGGTW